MTCPPTQPPWKHLSLISKPSVAMVKVDFKSLWPRMTIVQSSRENMRCESPLVIISALHALANTPLLCCTCMKCHNNAKSPISSQCFGLSVLGCCRNMADSVEEDPLPM